MSSEAQRIMNLSLMKIVSSRSRKGGVSLHRNLLVASVLFKARDVYAAEMAGLVVIRDGFVYDRSAVDLVDQKPETRDPSNDNLATDDNIIPDERVADAVNAVVLLPIDHDATQTQEHSELVDVEKISADDMHSEHESCKENIEPKDSFTKATKLTKSKRCRKQLRCPSRKRKFTEVEQAVLSITDTDECGVLEKKARMDDVHRNVKQTDCSELKPMIADWSYNRACVDSEMATDGQFKTELGISLCPSSPDYNSSLDTSNDPFSSSSDDQSTYDDDISSYQPNFYSFTGDYSTSPSTDGLGFSVSHSMLVVGGV